MWYRFEAMHGGGHMATDFEYEWFDYVLSPGDERATWDAWVTGEGFRDPIGGVALVSVLPSDVRRDLIEGCEERIREANEMLDRLGFPLPSRECPLSGCLARLGGSLRTPCEYPLPVPHPSTNYPFSPST